MFGIGFGPTADDDCTLELESAHTLSQDGSPITLSDEEQSSTATAAATTTADDTAITQTASER